jgi:hypothetical protein
VVGDVVVRGELGWWRLRARRDEMKLRFLGRLLRMAESRVVRKVVAVRMEEARRSGRGKGWCVRVAGLVEEYGLVEASRAAGQRSRKAVAEWESAVREAVWQKEEERWRGEVLAGRKLERYSRIKKELELEKFVDGGAVERKSAALKVRLRGGGSALEVEQGKYVGLERSERVCKVCGCGEVEDEEHFLLKCGVLEGVREKVWEAVRVAVERVGGVEVWSRFVQLGSSEKVDVLLSGRWEGVSEGVGGVFERATRQGMWQLWKARKLALNNRAGVSCPDARLGA